MDIHPSARPAPTTMRESLLRINRAVLAALHSLPEHWKWALAFFAAGRVLFSLWGVVLWKLGMGVPDELHRPLYHEIEPILDGPAGSLLGMWQRWDTIHYMRFALHGYIADEVTAFFPLYPLLARWLHQLTGMNILLALLVVSNVAYLLSLALLYRVAEMYYGPAAARRSLLAITLFPTSFYLYSAYPQSLLLLTILLAYWLAIRRRWLAVTVVSILGGLLHSTAALLAIPVGWQVIQFLRTDRNRMRWVTLIVPFTSLLGVSVFLAYREWMGFPSYTMLQETYFTRTLTLPWIGVGYILNYAAKLPWHIANFVPWLGIAVYLLAVTMTLVNRPRLPRPLWLYQFGMLVFLSSSSDNDIPLLSFLRYILVLFPFYFQTAALLHQRAVKLIFVGVGLLLCLFCSAMFFLWSWDIV